MRRARTMQWAAGAAVCVNGAVIAQVRFDNGPLLTTGNTCAVPPPGTISQTQLSNTTTGFTADSSIDGRVADDFLVNDANGWIVTGLVFYSYENGTGSTNNLFSGVNVRIWRGRPGDVGSTVVFGDTLTNRLTGSVFADTYRVRPTGILCSVDRAVFALTCSIPSVTLAQGTYWVDWQVSSPSALSGPWIPPVTLTGLAGKPGANAIGLLDPQTQQWVGLNDTASLVPQDLPFRVLGTVVGGASTCYPNCDHSTTQPFLNVADFGCFLNKFSAGDTYANCDASSIAPILNVNDFLCFLNSFGGGCTAP